MCRMIRYMGRAVFLAALALSGIAQASVEIHVATAYGADNFQTQNLQRYADDVAASTNGDVRLVVHPAGSLLKPSEIFQGVRDGKAGAGEVILSSLAKESPLFGIDALPFIVSGYDDARRMWDVSRSAIEQAFAQRGLKLLYAVPWPPQNLYSKSPINGIQDFRSMRMRTYNPATTRISELVGAKPVAIQAVDLSKAIADDKLDLMITSSGTGAEARAWSKFQHYYKISAWIPKNVVFISAKVFNKLDPQAQKKLLDAAQVAEDRGWKLCRESDRQSEEMLAANRIAVSSVDPLVRRYLDRIGETLAREWLKQAGNDELMVLLGYTTERAARTASLKSGS